MKPPRRQDAKKDLSVYTHDAWSPLRAFTAARVALGRSGGSVPTGQMLDFELAHAKARDAVYSAFDPQALAGEIEQLGFSAIILSSAATDRLTYLQRPDLGRRLDDVSRETLRDVTSHGPAPDLVIAVSDGLSALAVHRQLIPLLRSLLPLLREDGWQLSPVVLLSHGRVAAEDEIGAILGARLALMLIGERPGLGAPDSLGAYLVYGPRLGLTDANRNCVSNIRPEGLGHQEAAKVIHYLLTESRNRQLSGVELKDESHRLDGSDAHWIDPGGVRQSFSPQRGESC